MNPKRKTNSINQKEIPDTVIRLSVFEIVKLKKEPIELWYSRKMKFSNSNILFLPSQIHPRIGNP